jgi:signal transduction histidine kinase
VHEPGRKQTHAPKVTISKTAVARAICLLVAVMTFGLLAAAVPLRYQMLLDDAYGYGASLAEIGLSLRFFAACFTFFELLLAGGSWMVGVVIAWRKRGDWFALITAVTLMLFGFLPPLVDGLIITNAGWQTPIVALRWLCLTGLMTVFSLFPNGRFVPHWLRFVLIGWIGNAIIVNVFWPDILADTAVLPNTGSREDALWLLFGVAWFVPIVAAQLYRYNRVSTAVERQQTKWVIFGFTMTVAFSLISAILLTGFPGLRDDPAINTLAALTLGVIYLLSALLLPLTFAFAIFRYRLWQIDYILNRTLVYGVLSLGIVAIYALVVGGLGSLFHAQGNLLLTLLATGLIALLFQPAREWLQKTVNRLMFGERDDPYAVLSKLGRQLGETAVPTQTLPAITATITQTLKLPYAAIELVANDLVANEERQPAASSGERGTAVLQEWPLRYQGEIVGWLQAAPRSPGEPFTAKEQQLLGDIAAPAGAAAYSLRLTNALQKSREKLVLAREEERRRIRRDLHDELGPTLASQTFAIDAILDLLASDPTEVARLLRGLKAQNQATVSEIRRLVHELRPPALDELGLVSALQAHAAQLHNPHSLQIQITAWPDPLPPLSAAVEVAAYRIALEAMTNAARHAGAQSCAVRLQAEDSCLTLSIVDDGRGLEPNGRYGVGLHSMRERAEELGGKLMVDSGNGGGVRVTAVLPLSSAKQEGQAS